jgi:heptosyltransferase II
MNILIRLPNWLGDLVMSSAFLHAIKQTYPNGSVDVIVKKELISLAKMAGADGHIYPFSKNEYKGITGAYRFGKEISSQKKYDLFFSLPDSFSSAVIGFSSNAKNRIGYKKEFRNIFLTHKYNKPQNTHRVNEYIFLLEKFTGKKNTTPVMRLNLEPDNNDKSEKTIILNFNSEAQSRRMPVKKAIEITNMLCENINTEYILIGGNKDKKHVSEIFSNIAQKQKIKNISGNTTLMELTEQIAKSALMISTDSGPAHIANALKIPLIVFFGAGNENNTGPFNKINANIIRSENFECRCKVKNNCIYPEPKCITNINTNLITDIAKKITYNNA